MRVEVEEEGILVADEVMGGGRAAACDADGLGVCEGGF